ncbi:hypothetical protein BDB01DRAFT_781017 [Pilobolus umbonatus]|nr:hypothetical protein BDB01DRAFT_781017 [Pilobolus umbonatus]
MESFPTVTECSNWISEHCKSLLNRIEKDDVDIKSSIQTTLDSTIIMVKALNITKSKKMKLTKQLMNEELMTDNTEEQKKWLLGVQDICTEVNRLCQDQEYLSVINKDYIRERERILPAYYKVDYSSVWPDQIEEKACWFRNYFVGNPYITLIGPITEDRNDYAVISIVRESDKRVKQDEELDTVDYRIIIRTKQGNNMGFIVQESDAKEMMLQLESSHQLHQLGGDLEQKRTHPLKSLSSALNTNQHQSKACLSKKIMRAALLFLFQDLQFRYFKELSAEATILAGLEKEFLKYDEIGIPTSYKFGLLTVCEGQTTEEEWFSNSGISDGLKKLLDIIGEPIELKGYKGYSAGLDTKTGESGEISYRSSWKDHEIMFHIAPLMPSREHDVQQIHRKRYIGNDIVCIVFIEGKSQKFDPNHIKSQFLHVFILIQLETIDEDDVWRVEVIHHTNVHDFSPFIPSPALFYNTDDLKGFLILKLINAENSSLKSDKFSLPNNKARLCIFQGLLSMGLEAAQVIRPLDCNNINDSREEKKLSDTGYYKIERPKSAGAQQNVSSTIRHSFRSSSNINIEASISSIPEIPPIPFISRSSVLRDLKCLARRKSSNQISIPDIHNNYSIPNHTTNRKVNVNNGHLTSSNPNNNNNSTRSYMPKKKYGDIPMPLSKQQPKLNDIRESKYSRVTEGNPCVCCLYNCHSYYLNSTL